MVRFCVENLAFFDYNKLDELQHLTAALEKVVSDTGTGITHTIEVEIQQLNILSDQPMANALPDGQGGSMSSGYAAPISNVVPIAPARLRQLAVFSQILLLLWDLRTYLRRLWNLSRPTAVRGRPPAAGKDATAIRAPQRIPNSTSLTEKFLSRNKEIFSSLQSESKQRALCIAFAELMTVDNEMKVGGDNDDDADTSMTLGGANGDGYETPSEAGSGRSGSAGPGSAGPKRGLKRKSISGSHTNTPRKKGRPRRSATPQAKGSRKSRDGEDEPGGWD